MPIQSGQPPDPTAFTLQDVFAAALRGWWLLIAAVLAGALAALLVTFVQPPVYETSFSVLTTIDFTNSGEMTQFDEDLAMESVGGILSSPDLYARISAQAAQQGLQINPAWLKSSATVERRLGTWQVRLRGSDPRKIEAVARIWLKLGTGDLKAAAAHALSADGLMRKQLSLEACLAQSAAALPSSGQCAPGGLKTLQAELAASAQGIAGERIAARGLSSALIFDAFQKEPSAAQAVQFKRGQMVAAGALIGFVLAVWALQTGLPATLAAGLARRRRG
jgi:hypothetical protein